MKTIIPFSVFLLLQQVTALTRYSLLSYRHNAKLRSYGINTWAKIPNQRPQQVYRLSTTAHNDSIESNELMNKNNIRDQVVSVISGCGGIKVTVATIRNIVNEAMLTHSMTEVPADAIGRTMVSTLLLSNGMQAEQTFQLTIKGDGPLRGSFAISTGSGEVRGYVGNAGINGFKLQEAVGKGTIQVVKNHPEWPRPFNGITAMRHGDIDRDVGIYLAESEQRSCALAAATSISGVLCKAAGGYLVEQLPDVQPEVIRKVEQNLQQLVKKDGGKDDIPANLLLKGVTPLEIAQIILDGCDMQSLGQITPQMKCNCSEDRLFRSIRLLPREEVEDILKEHEQIEARCHFCGKQYRLGPDAVRERLDKAEGDPSKETDI